jgi:hypothetical protein
MAPGSLSALIWLLFSGIFPSFVRAVLPVTVIDRFSQGSWCENLAVRRNGQILTTRLDTPEVLLVNPTGKPAPRQVAAWSPSEYKGCLGIAEIQPDVFYVALSEYFNGDFVRTSGVASIFKVDLSTFRLSSTGELLSNATVAKVTDIVGANLLNGMIALDSTHILVADSNNGWVYKVDTTTGEHSVAINDPKMKYSVVANPSVDIGVNGIKIRKPHLYWTNSAAGTLNGIKINDDGTPIGKSFVVTDSVTAADDFIIGDDGSFFIAQNGVNQLSILLPGSPIAKTIAGSKYSTELAGVTAAKFGRLPADSHRLYLTTCGGEPKHNNL